MKHSFIYCLVSFCVLLMVTMLGLFYQGTPSPGALNAASEVYSSGRAMVHLQEIAKTPHPSGSVENEAVLSYLQKTLEGLGLHAELQTFSAKARGGNLWAVLKGSDSKHTILFSAHYDSVDHSPGAGDNGAAVAALLEAIRTLQNGPPIKNDLAFLFTDEEEIGAKGAKAFAEEAPMASKVALVVNLDGRGSTGPVQMFETTANNDWLIEEFARATRAAVGTSLANDIYKRMSNFTDFTIYKESLGEAQGLNFAHVDNPRVYHNMNDTIANFDERVLQHQGQLVTDLATHFGNLTEFQQAGKDRIYFTLPLMGMFTYSSSWSPVLLLLLVVLFVITFRKAYVQGSISIKGVLSVLLLYPVCIFLILMVCNITWQVIRGTNVEFQAMTTGHPANGGFFFVGIMLLTTLLMMALSYLWTRRFWLENLRFGVLTFLLLMTIAVSMILPGGSYMFSLSLVCTFVAHLIIMNQGESEMRRLVAMLFSIPILLILTPVLSLVYLGMGMSAVGGISVLTSTMLGFLLINRLPSSQG